MNNNCDLPKHIYAFLRTEFVNNLADGTHGLIPCVIFAVESLPGRAVGFHVLREDGALVAQVPIHALCHRADAPQMKLNDLQKWDCFGFWITAIEFEYLYELEFGYRKSGGDIETGAYICTLDFLDNGFSDAPEQHKNFHLLKLDNGNFALQPNNRCRVIDRSFTENLFTWDQPPAIKTNKLVWHCEKL